MFASHGFQNVAEKARLGRFVLEKVFHDQKHENLSAAERVRICFEQLGPTFVKLGQLLATRPDLIPLEFVEEFKKLHDRVRPISYEEVRKVLQEQYGDLSRVFDSIDEEPLASASIAQVHKAILKNKEQIVIKVQRPGIVEIIEDDLQVLYTIVGLLETYVPESKVYNPRGIVDEFFKTLELETNFMIEANNILRFEKNFANYPKIRIPKLYLSLCGPQVLVMEALQGVCLTDSRAFSQDGLEREVIASTGLKVFFKMVFQDRFFHGDLHAGNLFILPDNTLGLIDFGVVGRLSERMRDTIADMLVALSREDYEHFANLFIEIAPYTDYVDVDRFSRDLRDVIAPYFGMSFKNVNLGRLLMEATSVAARYQLSVPSELMLFFKAIVTVEGMGRMVVEDFDLLSYSLEFAHEIIKAKYDPDRLFREMGWVTKDITTLLQNLPRQLKHLIRRMQSPNHAWRVRIDGIDELKRSVETSSNIIFLGLIIGSLILSSSILITFEKGPEVAGLPLLSSIGFALSFILSFAAFFNYIRK